MNYDCPMVYCLHASIEMNDGKCLFANMWRSWDNFAKGYHQWLKFHKQF